MSVSEFLDVLRELKLTYGEDISWQPLAEGLHISLHARTKDGRPSNHSFTAYLGHRSLRNTFQKPPDLVGQIVKSTGRLLSPEGFSAYVRKIMEDPL